MNKIIYKKITIDDNWMLVTQALIDKQGEIIEVLDNHIRNHKEICRERMKSGDYEHDVGKYYDEP